MSSARTIGWDIIWQLMSEGAAERSTQDGLEGMRLRRDMGWSIMADWQPWGVAGEEVADRTRAYAAMHRRPYGRLCIDATPGSSVRIGIRPQCAYPRVRRRLRQRMASVHLYSG